ncbi:MAG: GNAT family N-acetyltransferase [Proteobacteria bacterium]|nr:GNAT family N-acetyltransferase [Pseudomonadota bacterium]
MSAEVGLRPARPADAPAIAGIHIETWRAAYAGIVPDAYLVAMTESKQTLQWNNTIRSAVAPEVVLVAESSDLPGGRVVGFGSCGRARKRRGTGEVFTLYVAPDWQGRGIGRRLLHGLLAKLKAGGLNEALVWVLSDNPARFFYEAMGARRAAERQERFAGVHLDEAAYAWGDLAAWLAERAGEGPA